MADWDASGSQATRESPYPSGLKGQGVVVTTMTGTGTDSTEQLAAVASTQHHIIGGFVAAPAAATITIYSAATVIAIMYFATAGIQALPPVYTVAGEALNVKQSVASCFICTETIPVVDGQYASLTG